MGTLDGAEVYELVGLFILHNLQDKLDVTSLGLYIDGRLAVMKNHSGSANNHVRKQLIKIFKTFGLKITVQTNLTLADFLDVNLNLESGKHQPYRNRMMNHCIIFTSKNGSFEHFPFPPKKRKNKQ